MDRGAITRRIEELLQRRLQGVLTLEERAELADSYARELGDAPPGKTA